MNVLLAAAYFLHLIATVVWLGGLVILGLLVWPEARRTLSDGDENRRFLLNLQRRFRPWANLSLLVLLGTGLLQMAADPHYEGLLAVGNTWSVAMLLKHLAFGGMVVVMLALQFGVAPAIERAALLAQKGQPEALAAAQHRERRLAGIMLGLGGLVLLFTAIATAL